MKVLFIGGTGNISVAVSNLAIKRGIDLYLLNRGNTGITIEGAKTITAWIKTSADFYGMFFDWSVDGTAGRNIRFGLQNGKLRFETSSGYALYETTLLNNGAWHMVGLIIEAGDKTNEVQFFIDGTIFNPTSSTSYAINTHATGAEIRLGVGGTSNNLPWNGLVDDVRIWRKK